MKTYRLDARINEEDVNVYGQSIGEVFDLLRDQCQDAEDAGVLKSNMAVWLTWEAGE